MSDNMAESDLKNQAIKMGLQVGSNIKIERIKKLRGTVVKVMLTGKIIALYPYVFIAEMKCIRGKVKESFQYGQVVLTKEVRMCKAKDQQRNKNCF